MLKWLFGSLPKVGSRWLLRGKRGNPWEDEIRVIVTDTRAGWVRYRFYDQQILYAKPVGDFRMIYKEIKDV